METKIVNAKIETATVMRDERNPVHLFLVFEYKVGVQGLPLELKHLNNIFDVFEVEELERLVGKPCRLEVSGKALCDRRIEKIIHFLKDQPYVYLGDEEW
jgi:hypothetical protein